jgi:hypothetical protein
VRTAEGSAAGCMVPFLPSTVAAGDSTEAVALAEAWAGMAGKN